VTTLSWLLLACAVGGVDVLYFHVLRFKLYSRKQSQIETVTHLVQGFSFLGVLFACVGAPDPARWHQTIQALFVVHFAATFADACVERQSRLDFGGIPTPEYVLHVGGAVLTGIAFGSQVGSVPASATQGPAWLALGWIAALGGATMSAVETALLVRTLYRAKPIMSNQV
jgi:hypothetical protein